MKKYKLVGSFISITIMLAGNFIFAQPRKYVAKFVDSIAVSLTALPDDTTKVNNLAELAAMHLLTNPALTIQYAKQGAEIAEKINYPIGKINCLAQTAFFYAITGDWAKATADVNEAIPLCEKYDPEKMVHMYNIMYIVAATKEDYLDALMYAQKSQHEPAFSTFPEIKKWPTYMQLGRTYEILNKLDSAIYYADILVNYINKYGSIEPDLVSNSNTLILSR